MLEESYENKDIFDFLNEAFKRKENGAISNSTYQEDLKTKNNNLGDSINYGEGIYSKRLMEGMLYDIDLLEIGDEMVQSDEESFNLEKSVFREKIRYMDQKYDESSSKKRHKAIKDTINNIRELGKIKIFKILSLIWILVIVGLSSLQLRFSQNFFDNTEELVDMLLGANRQLRYFTRIMSNVYDLEFLQE